MASPPAQGRQVIITDTVRSNDRVISAKADTRQLFAFPQELTGVGSKPVNAHVLAGDVDPVALRIERGAIEKRAAGVGFPFHFARCRLEAIERSIPAADVEMFFPDQRHVPDGGSGLRAPCSVAIRQIHRINRAIAGAKKHFPISSGASMQNRCVDLVRPDVPA